MKIRQGFVSNSSSSSFVVRGTKVSKKEMMKIFDIEQNDDLDSRELTEVIWGAFHNSEFKKALSIMEAEDNYDNVGDDLIIGKNILYLEEGIAEKIPEINDTPIKEKIEELLNREVKLETYVQFIRDY